MALTPIEILALIFIVAAIVKVAIIVINPKAWGSVVKKVYTSPLVTTILSLILGYLVLVYLLKELTIVQILAVMLFTGLVMALSVATYAKEMLGLYERMLKDKNILKKAWFPIVVWIILLLWGLKEIFMAA